MLVSGLCSASYSDFDAARKHPGTDEDLILVKFNQISDASNLNPSTEYVTANRAKNYIVQESE